MNIFDPVYLGIAFGIVALIVVYYYLYMREGFDSASDKITMTLYYLPTCGHCKDMMAEWNKFQEKYENSEEYHVNKVDCSKDSNIRILAFPTIIKTYPDGSEFVFDGARTEAAFASFLKIDNRNM